MKTLLFCWELGMGNGHVGPFERLARRFLDDGWRVIIIARDLSRVSRFFKPGEVAAYQAPFKIDPAIPYIKLPETFAQMFLNLGYRCEDELRQMIDAWRLLFRQINPDLIVFDHSPTAILAARGLLIPQMTIGHGFYVPNDNEPMDCIRPGKETPASDRLKQETEVVNRINKILLSNQQPELERLGAMYSDVTRNLFTTFRELDHFGPRPNAEYFGTWSISRQAELVAPPPWPAGTGPKIYAYLKSTPALKALMAWLTQCGVPVIVVLDAASPNQLRPYVGPNITLCDQPVSMDVICQECDIAITNAGHGTICQLMLAGICQMLIPLTLEQGILSSKVKSLGAGLDAQQNQTETMMRHLSMLIDKPDHFGGAGAFQKRYATWSENEAIENIFSVMTQSDQSKNADQ